MNKKIIKLVGGLGNQMFQYAFAYALCKKHNADLILDLSWFEEVKNHENVTPRFFEIGVFNINYKEATSDDLNLVTQEKHRSKFEKFMWNNLKIKKYAPTSNTVVETSAYFVDKDLFNNPDYYYYDGYYQCEGYFKNIRSEILNCFTLKEPAGEKNDSVLYLINSTNSVSLHIRRGDYVTLDCASKYHGLCSLDYYERAIKYIAKKVKNPHFFLFSDDIPWVIENLKIDYPYTVIDFNQGKGHLDMNLMKSCKHNIIANSSFSWWGAWLNQNEGKIVIAPKKWNTQKFKRSDVIPKQWKKL